MRPHRTLGTAAAFGVELSWQRDVLRENLC